MLAKSDQLVAHVGHVGRTSHCAAVDLTGRRRRPIGWPRRSKTRAPNDSTSVLVFDRHGQPSPALPGGQIDGGSAQAIRTPLSSLRALRVLRVDCSLLEGCVTSRAAVAF